MPAKKKSAVKVVPEAVKAKGAPPKRRRAPASPDVLLRKVNKLPLAVFNRKMSQLLRGRRKNFSGTKD